MSQPIYEDPQACHVHYQNMSTSVRSFSPDSSRAHEIITYAKAMNDVKNVRLQVRMLQWITAVSLVLIIMNVGMVLYLIIAHHVPSRVVIKEEFLSDVAVTSDTPRAFPMSKGQCDYILEAISTRINHPILETRNWLHRELRDISNEVKLLLLSQITELSLMTETNSTLKYVRGPKTLKDATAEEMTMSLNQLINDIQDLSNRRSQRTHKSRVSRSTPDIGYQHHTTLPPKMTPQMRRITKNFNNGYRMIPVYHKDIDME
ncbi:putative TM protein [Jeilongvirus chaetodipodis]|uniref:TM protein n=1 Tax=Paramyxoviridae sp. TaxID=1663356 RepID=A0AC61TNW3_9MONO|nr:putative TM protein [Paramyxoviridae sp.]